MHYIFSAPDTLDENTPGNDIKKYKYNNNKCKFLRVIKIIFEKQHVY